MEEHFKKHWKKWIIGTIILLVYFDGINYFTNIKESNNTSTAYDFHLYNIHLYNWISFIGAAGVFTIYIHTVGENRKGLDEEREKNEKTLNLQQEESEKILNLQKEQFEKEYQREMSDINLFFQLISTEYIDSFLKNIFSKEKFVNQLKKEYVYNLTKGFLSKNMEKKSGNCIIHYDFLIEYNNNEKSEYYFNSHIYELKTNKKIYNLVNDIKMLQNNYFISDKYKGYILNMKLENLLRYNKYLQNELDRIGLSKEDKFSNDVVKKYWDSREASKNTYRFKKDKNIDEIKKLLKQSTCYLDEVIKKIELNEGDANE